MTLVDERARRVVLAEHRDAGDEDEVEPALGIDHDEPAVERQVEVALLLVPRGAQLAEGACRDAVDAELGDERPALGRLTKIERPL